MPTITEMRQRSASAMARRFAVDAADGLKEAADKAVDHAETMIMWLQEAGASANQIDDLRKLLLDMLGDIQGGINKTLDNEGEVTDDHRVDVSSLTPMPADEPLFGDVRRLRVAPRFPEVSCSQCGQSFGPGDNGFSHCKNHAGLRGKP